MELELVNLLVTDANFVEGPIQVTNPRTRKELELHVLFVSRYLQ